MEPNSILIDTSIIIEHLRKQHKHKSVLYNILDIYELYTSTIVEFELFMGAMDERKREDIKKVLEKCTILPFTSEIAQKSATIYQKLKAKNQIIEVRDLFIASTAIIYDLPVMTFNTKHFSRIDTLQLRPPPKIKR